MPTAVDAASAEIYTTLAGYAEAHEGLRDFARLNLKPETMRVVRELLEFYDRRTARLLATKSAIDALIAEGHPTLPTPEVSDGVLADLAANAHSIGAALPLFGGVAPAAALGLTSGDPEPK